MSFWATANNASSSMTGPLKPWEFAPATEITAQIRGDKEARQQWYQNTNTVHQFYTGFEPANPNQRPSKDNPVRAIHAFVADYDLPLTDEKINEKIAKMGALKPTYVETSLGGNCRLVWVLEKPILTVSPDFTAFVLLEARMWLQLDLLPGLDEGAWKESSRLYCNGCSWRQTGAVVSEAESQSFFVSCGNKFTKFSGLARVTIPLAQVEAEITKKFPAAAWPGPFSLGSQGPSFWIPGSTSPKSAIVKDEGMLTFAAHAEKPFYSWADILGKEFVADIEKDAILLATKDVFFDGEKYWRKNIEFGLYESINEKHLRDDLIAECSLSPKVPKGQASSPLEDALRHIRRFNRIVGIAPIIFSQPGRLVIDNQPHLNTYRCKPMQPYGEPVQWGERFPFLARLLDSLFDPPEQKERFLAWFKYFYECALNHTPRPGQAVILAGGPNLGKTLTNRHMVGEAVGGHVDASSFLLGQNAFNSELFDKPLWCMDDDTPSATQYTRNTFSAMLKKTTANATTVYRKKFVPDSMIIWEGRIFCTINLDAVSLQLLTSLDNTSKDKINLFRAHANSTMEFPSRLETLKIIRSELPFFLRWLLDWTPGAHILRDPRYGFQSYQEARLFEKAQMSGGMGDFIELLEAELQSYFLANPTIEVAEMTGIHVTRLLHANPLNHSLLRNVSPSRFLERLDRAGRVPFLTKPHGRKLLYCFQRKDFV